MENNNNNCLAPGSTRHPKHPPQTNKTFPPASFPATVSHASALERPTLPGAAPSDAPLLSP
ncbi:hypothetical protein CGRA01v4_05117 [Colletotrichum graminicola]|nr:hypothetical protein CGRA01v4_05117 [Colletotrichum graminicola]